MENEKEMRRRKNQRREVRGIRKGERKERKKEMRRSKHERRRETDRERETGERNKKGDFPSIPTVEARRSKKKSRSTHRELLVDTKILEFHQTPRGREFSYFDYF